MKKIIITAAFITVSFIGYSQTTYTKVVKNGDTLLRRSFTVVDTLKRKEIKAEIQLIKASKQANLESIDILKALNNRHNARLVELNALLLKTD